MAFVINRVVVFKSFLYQLLFVDDTRLANIVTVETRSTFGYFQFTIRQLILYVSCSIVFHISILSYPQSLNLDQLTPIPLFIHISFDLKAVDQRYRFHNLKSDRIWKVVAKNKDTTSQFLILCLSIRIFQYISTLMMLATAEHLF